MSVEPKPRRSDATRASILDAARRRFGAEGFQKATIRSIAADAQIDPSMVMRYFESKANLFAAASVVDLQAPSLGDVPLEEAGLAYATNVMSRWEAGGNVVEEALLRTATTQTDAAQQIQRVFDEQIGPAITAAMPDAADARERAALALAQSIGVIYCRYILGIEPIASMDPQRLTAAMGAAISVHISGESLRGS